MVDSDIEPLYQKIVTEYTYNLNKLYSLGKTIELYQEGGITLSGLMVAYNKWRFNDFWDK